MNCLPLLVKSYIGLSNFVFEQNILKKLTIPVKLQHPFSIVGSFSFRMASNILLSGFNKSSSFAIWAFFEGVKSNKSSIITSLCFLLCKHSKIAFMYDCQIEGEIFNPIGIL